MSIDKARRRLGYEPRYSSLAAIQEAVTALITASKVQAPKGWQQWRSTLEGGIHGSQFVSFFVTLIALALV
jgi:hypothetical protein